MFHASQSTSLPTYEREKKVINFLEIYLTGKKKKKNLKGKETHVEVCESCLYVTSDNVNTRV